MNEQLKEILESREILGSHLQHLAKSPRDFFELTKINPELALRYAQQFSAGHVITLIAQADEHRFRLISEMLQFQPNTKFYTDKIFPPLNDDEKETMKRYIFHNIRVEEYLCSKDDVHYFNDYKVCLNNRIIRHANYNIKQNVGIVKEYSLFINESCKIVYENKIIMDINIRDLMNVYQNIKAEEAWEKATPEVHQQLAMQTVDTLLSKLDSTVFITDKENKKRKVLDFHFVIRDYQVIPGRDGKFFSHYQEQTFLIYCLKMKIIY